MPMAVRNYVEYLEKLNSADEQIKNGQVITKTMDELLTMEESFKNLLLQQIGEEIQENNRGK